MAPRKTAVVTDLRINTSYYTVVGGAEVYLNIVVRSTEALAALLAAYPPAPPRVKTCGIAGIKEDLSDAIYSMGAEETPFLATESDVTEAIKQAWTAAGDASDIAGKGIAPDANMIKVTTERLVDIKQPTLDDVTGAMTAAIARGVATPVLRAIVDSFGVARASHIPEESWVSAIAALEAAR